MRVLWPMAATGAPSLPIHKGPRRNRSIPSCRRSTCSAAVKRPGPRAKSRALPLVARLPHVLDSRQRLQRAQQDARARTRLFARHIEQIRGAVAQIHIGVSNLEKQRTITRRHAAKGVTRGIAFADTPRSPRCGPSWRCPPAIGARESCRGGSVPSATVSRGTAARSSGWTRNANCISPEVRIGAPARG